MANEVTDRDETEPVIEPEPDKAGKHNFDCGGKFTKICREISRYFFAFASLAALALSIVAIVLANREDTRLSQSNNDLNSVKEEVKACYNDTYERMQELARKIDQVDESLKDLIAETKSSLENKIRSVESGLNTRFISVQTQVSDMNTNVNKMQTSLGSFEDSTNKGFSKVWEEFKEVDKEIANLPKNCGSLVYCYMRNYMLYFMVSLFYCLM